jgi:hypothetical protein
MYVIKTEDFMNVSKSVLYVLLVSVLLSCVPQKSFALSGNEKCALLVGGVGVGIAAYLLWPPSYEDFFVDANRLCNYLEQEYNRVLYNCTEANIAKAVAAQEPYYCLFFFRETITYPFLRYEKYLSERIRTLERHFKISKRYYNKLSNSPCGQYAYLIRDYDELVHRQKFLLDALQKLKVSLKAMDRFYAEQKDQRADEHAARMESIALAKLNL